MKILLTFLLAAAIPGVALAASVDKTTFVKTVAGANRFEIESSKLALTRPTSDDVKAFANQMITDHEMAGEELGQILRAEGDVPMVNELASKEADMLTELNAATGAKFEASYVEMQLKAHEQAVSLFQTYAGNPDDKALGQFAKKMLPTLEMHLEHARALSTDKS